MKLNSSHFPFQNTVLTQNPGAGSKDNSEGSSRLSQELMCNGRPFVSQQTAPNPSERSQSRATRPGTRKRQSCSSLSVGGSSSRRASNDSVCPIRTLIRPLIRAPIRALIRAHQALVIAAEMAACSTKKPSSQHIDCIEAGWSAFWIWKQTHSLLWTGALAGRAR